MTAIHIAPLARSPMVEISEASLIAGSGIAGDRYHLGQGTFSDWPRDHQLTLVESEILMQVSEKYGIDLGAGQSRRNLTTSGIRLNDLVGHLFHIGDVLCEGTRRCEPCAHLEVVTRLGGLARLLAGRGGLRAKILENGTVRVGDSIQCLEAAL